MSHPIELTVILPVLADLLAQQTKVSKKFLNRAKKIAATHSLDSLKFAAVYDELPDPLPMANVTAIADGLSEKKFWLRADPLHFTVDLSHIYHLNQQPIVFAAGEMEELAQLIQPLLAEFNLVLKTPCHERWYLQCETIPKITSFSPADFLGKSLMNYFLRGEESQFWLKLFTEIQMLLQHSVINQRRRAKGDPTIDALWFWGQGAYPCEKRHKVYERIITDDVVALGLSKIIKNPVTIIEGDFFSSLVQQTFLPGKYLIIAAQPLPTACSQDEVMLAIDNYFAYFKGLLLAKKITSLRLYLGDKHCYHVEAAAFPWWQRFHPAISRR